MSKIEARHGDVDLFRINKLPAGVRKVKGTTVALGESSGHHHTIYALDTAKVTVYEGDVAKLVDKYVVIEGGQAVIRHQEHESIVLNSGIYEVKIEQDFNPFEKEYKRVID